MWARLESNTIVEILTRPKALNIGGTQYPSNIFSMWTDAELASDWYSSCNYRQY